MSESFMESDEISEELILNAEIHHIINKYDEIKNNSKEFISIRAKYPTDNIVPFETLNSESKEYTIDKNSYVRVYCDGIYDLFHYGHARSLQQAKNLFPNTILIVGVPADALTLRLKGNVVMSDIERVESLKHCKYVDEIIENSPWEITPEFLDKYKIDFVAHDEAPYAQGNVSDIYYPIKKINRFVPTKRTLGISTTGLVTKIVKDYDKYIRRNLERGISPKELNISLLKELDIKFQKKMQNLNQNFKKEMRKIRKEISFALNFWEKKKDVFVKKFISTFYSSINNLKGKLQPDNIKKGE